MSTKQPRETDLVNACLQLLNLRGVYAWRANSGAAVWEGKDGKKRFVRFNGAKGCSDIIGILPRSGKFLAVEVKRLGRKATPEQKSFLANVTAQGGLALLVHDPAQLDTLLEGYL